jgi:hypothetical protein
MDEWASVRASTEERVAPKHDIEERMRRLRPPTDESRLRAFAKMCCERIPHLLVDEASRNALLFSESAECEDAGRRARLAAAAENAHRRLERVSARLADAAKAAVVLLAVPFDVEAAILCVNFSIHAASYRDDDSLFPDPSLLKSEEAAVYDLLRGMPT